MLLLENVVAQKRWYDIINAPSRCLINYKWKSSSSIDFSIENSQAESVYSFALHQT